MNTTNLYLKGINLADLIRRYKDGELQNITQLRGSNLTCQVIQLRKYGDNYHDPTFIAKDGNDYNIISYTAGTKFYEFGSFLPAIPAGSMCHNCPEITKKPSIGFILEIQHFEESGTINLICYKNFCSFECHLRKLITEQNKNQLATDYLLKDANKNLCWLFDKLYPGVKLKPSPEPELHEGYGGSMSSEEFHTTTHEYQITNNIFISPIKRQYIQT